MQLAPVPFDKFILENNHPLVEQQRSKLIEATAALEPDSGDVNSGKGWLDKHDEYVKSKGWEWTQIQATTKHLYDNAWYTKMKQRKQEVLQMSLYGKEMGDRAALAQAITLDISQSVGRVPMGLDGICQTLTPKADNWMISHERSMLGYEALALQGFCCSCFFLFAVNVILIYVLIISSEEWTSTCCLCYVHPSRQTSTLTSV